MAESAVHESCVMVRHYLQFIGVLRCLMEKSSSHEKEPLPDIVNKKCKKKLDARQKRQRSLFFGLGVFGVVGWSVAIPTLIGAMIGRWLDAHSNLQISWTLTCIFLGMVVGCVIAWNWINKEGKPE